MFTYQRKATTFNLSGSFSWVTTSSRNWDLDIKIEKIKHYYGLSYEEWGKQTELISSNTHDDKADKCAHYILWNNWSLPIHNDKCVCYILKND